MVLTARQRREDRLIQGTVVVVSCDRVLLGEVLDCLPILNFDSWKIRRRQDLLLAFGGRIGRMDR